MGSNPTLSAMICTTRRDHKTYSVPLFLRSAIRGPVLPWSAMGPRAESILTLSSSSIRMLGSSGVEQDRPLNPIRLSGPAGFTGFQDPEIPRTINS